MQTLPLAKHDLASVFQGEELPANKRVVVRIDTSGDEGAATVHLYHTVDY